MENILGNIKTYLQKNKLIFIQLFIVVIVIVLVRYWVISHEENLTKELNNYGVNTKGVITSIVKSKRGYDIHYSYVDNDYLVNVSRIEPNIHIGKQYLVRYSNRKPEMHRIYLDMDFESEDRVNISRNCKCSIANVRLHKDDYGNTRLLSAINSDSGVINRDIYIQTELNIKDGEYLVLYDSKNYNHQKIFLDIPFKEKHPDSFPTSVQCLSAISRLKHDDKLQYIY